MNKKPLQGGMSNKIDMKIFILYLLDHINYPLDYDTVQEVVSASGFVGNFDFAECFSELIEAEHVLMDDVDGVAYFAISEKGRNIAKELQGKIIAPIREKSLRVALRLLSFRKNGASATCEYALGEDGRYDVHCEIREGGREVLDLHLPVRGEELAAAIKAKFDRSPEGTYRGILSVMSGEIDYLLQ